jgi:hypothetical protein
VNGIWQKAVKGASAQFLNFWDHMRADTKIPGIVKKKLFKIFAQVWNFRPFKVLPLWLDALIPVLLPLLETLSNILNGNAVKVHQQFLSNLCNISKMPPFQILIHPWEQKKVARSETGRVVEVGRNCHFISSQKGGILLPWQSFKENRWWALTAFSLKISDDVSSSRSGTEIAASSHRGTAVNSKVSKSYEQFKLIFLTFPGIFGSPLVQTTDTGRLHNECGEREEKTTVCR